MSTTTILVLVLLSGLAGPEGTPKLRIEEPEYGIGECISGTVVRRTFRLWNDGTAPLVLQRLQPC